MSEIEAKTNAGENEPETKVSSNKTKAEYAAENEALLKELEALRLEKDAAAKASAVHSAPEAHAVTSMDDAMRPVEVTLMYDGEKYKRDLYVHNGDKPPYQIKRGVPVIVPYHIAQTIKESMEQDAATAKLIAIREAAFQANATMLTP